MSESVNLIDIWKKYPKSKDYALQNISLKFKAGHIHILLGENGSGKTTLLKIIAHLLTPSKGKVNYPNTEFKRSRKHLQRQLGILFDHVAHWDDLTGYENAWFFAKSYGVTQEKINSKLENFFKLFDLWSKKDDLVKTYSYGMRRKLALIEALFHDPKILLLDEPSMGLDYSSRISLYNYLKDQTSKETMIIIASNDVNEAAFLANEVSMLNKGILLTSGVPKDLMKALTPYIKVELTLTIPISLEGLNSIKNLKELKVENDSKEQDFKITILAEPKTTSDYSVLLADIIDEIVRKNGQIRHIEIKSPNLGDLFLKLGGQHHES